MSIYGYMSYMLNGQANKQVVPLLAEKLCDSFVLSAASNQSWLVTFPKENDLFTKFKNFHGKISILGGKTDFPSGKYKNGLPAAQRLFQLHFLPAGNWQVPSRRTISSQKNSALVLSNGVFPENPFLWQKFTPPPPKKNTNISSRGLSIFWPALLSIARLCRNVPQLCRKHPNKNRSSVEFDALSTASALFCSMHAPAQCSRYCNLSAGLKVTYLALL